MLAETPVLRITSMEDTPRRLRLLALGCGVCMGTAARAQQWSVTRLHPEGNHSVAFAAHGLRQAGYVHYGWVNNQWVDARHAVLWNGTSQSWVSLHPAGAVESQVLGMDGAQQVGFIRNSSGYERGGLWTGSAGSWIDLTPPEWSSSYVTAVKGGVQVGSAGLGAAMWTGTVQSYRSLHPANAPGASRLMGLGDGQQVGTVVVDDEPHASLWTGTAQSWVDLHPPGATRSWALDAAAGQQVGAVVINDWPQARIWYGSASNWTSLTPAGFGSSTAYSTTGEWQVGHVIDQEARFHASIWRGNAESWEDLSLVLPGSWGDTFAQAVWADATTLRVAGWGRNMQNGSFEALLWTLSIPTPSSLTLVVIGAILSARRHRRN
jgi:hypothetical protein